MGESSTFDYMISLQDISPVVFGAGALNNGLYGKDPGRDVTGSLRAAFKAGINAIDTSAYYGNSEKLIGDALHTLENEIKRQDIFITTKCGRWEDNTFDYSPDSIRRSLHRSLERLRTCYVDALLIHDIEFQNKNQIIDALKTAVELKNQGLCRFVGFSGYPVGFLVEMAEEASELGIPIDVVLSYCNMTLQNDLLAKSHQRFLDAGVQLVFNASPLSMALLRDGAVPDWHPASGRIKERTATISRGLKERGVELADLALAYTFNQFRGPNVVGLRTPNEVETAMYNYKRANELDLEAVQYVRGEFGDAHCETWPSGFH